MKKGNEVKLTFVCLILALFLITGAIAQAVTMFGVPATIDDIAVKAKTMKVTYTDPDTNKTKRQTLYWDNSTEFIKEGTPPEFKDSLLKPDSLTKGMKVYVVISSEEKGGKARADKVSLKQQQ